ncbi:TPA: hypothetical protein DCW38_06095 [candidate division WOR-3 bacterium]|uniref:PTS EIIA type-2 domain-containing protein n=1 Tax=candidate division WOR-3 bacterium TaxID=2052148 RepID=A0A350HB18_UNCW3|nr:hypothetical protein [candidate division WOR-3 bacterium]
MDLKIKDISLLLNVNEKEIMRLIERREIPFYRINRHFRFNKGEISEWILRKGGGITGEFVKLQNISKPAYLTELIKNGGIYYNIEADDIKSALANIVELLPLSENINRETLLSYLLEREEMMPTYIGKGISVPHPKKPIISETDMQMVAICFLKNRFAYGKAGEELHTLFVIISSNQANHLKTLSLISYMLQKNEFAEILEKRSSKEEIIFEIEKQLMREKL